MSGSPHQLKVGRSTGCELRIDDASVSGVHARLVVDNGRLRIFDAGSANGVFVNGARVNDAWIAWGDHVLLGRAPLPWNHPSLAPLIQLCVDAPDPAAETLLLDSPFEAARAPVPSPRRTTPASVAAPDAEGEKEFFRDGHYFVTDRRLANGREVVAMSQLVSVALRREDPPRGTPMLLAGLGVIASLLGPVLVLTDEGPDIGLFGPLVFLVGAALLTTGALWLRSLRPTWHVVLATSAGHVSFVSVYDRAWAEGFQQAVQLAMVARG